MRKYFGLFKSLADIEDEFKVVTGLGPDDILFAYYDYKDYSGKAVVLFVSPADGQLSLVLAYHCSCNGLENEWEPEIMSWKALQKAEYLTEIDDKSARDAFRKLVESNLKS
mgnify:CR=1 FL=1